MRMTVALFSAAALFVSLEAAAQSPVLEAEAGHWQQVHAAGMRSWQTSQKTGAAHSSYSIACDIAFTGDHSGTGFTLGLNGQMLPANAEVTFKVAGQSIAIPSGKSGGITMQGCPECADKFRALWPLLRQGESVEITAADGNSATLSLEGLAALMPAEPCKTP